MNNDTNNETHTSKRHEQKVSASNHKNLLTLRWNSNRLAILQGKCSLWLFVLHGTMTGKNMGPGRFRFRQIGHLDENFIPKPCLDYKLDTLTRLGSGPGCSMSRSGCPNVDMIWFLDILIEICVTEPKPIFQRLDPVVWNCFYKIFYRICTKITHKSSYLMSET